MTTDQLNDLLDDLNNDRYAEHIFLRPLTSNIDCAIVWDYTTNAGSNIKSISASYHFYFIKDEKNVFIATVCDMNTDLHWFVITEHRGKRHLTNALKTTILPHLFQDGRTEQRITIDYNAIGKDNFTASKKVAESLGFSLVENKSGLMTMNLSSADFSNKDYIEGYNTETSEKRIDTLKDRARQISRELQKIHNELEMKLGYREEIEEIKEISDFVKKVPTLINDVYYFND